MRKSARAVTPDRSFVETQDTKLHPVQAHRPEGMIQCKAYGMPADPPPEICLPKEADCQFHLAIFFVQGMKAEMPDRLPLRFYDTGERMPVEPFQPFSRSFDTRRRKLRRVSTVHANDPGGSRKAKMHLSVSLDGLSQGN